MNSLVDAMKHLKILCIRKRIINLKKDLLLRVNDFDKIEKPIQKIKPYITQSWLNINKNGTYHYEHSYPNHIYLEFL